MFKPLVLPLSLPLQQPLASHELEEVEDESSREPTVRVVIFDDNPHRSNLPPTALELEL